MTRTVRDNAALLDVITGFDARDWSAMPTPARSFLDGIDDGVAGLRIALLARLWGLSPTIRRWTRWFAPRSSDWPRRVPR